MNKTRTFQRVHIPFLATVFDLCFICVSLQAAALAVCQYLAVESAHPSSPLFEESSSSEATTPVTVQHVRPPKQKKQKTSPVPPLPIVLQLMEMGFARKNIEYALKSLSGTTGSASGVPGNISYNTQSMAKLHS